MDIFLVFCGRLRRPCVKNSVAMHERGHQIGPCAITPILGYGKIHVLPRSSSTDRLAEDGIWGSREAYLTALDILSSM